MIDENGMNIVKILVVDSDVKRASDIADMLKNLGYQMVGTAASGREAIALTADEWPDLVLMSIYLKGKIDGIAAADRIYRRYQIPSVFMATHEDEDKMRKARITKTFGHILLPFDEEELQVTIEISLDRHRLEDDQRMKARMLDESMSGIMLTDLSGNIHYANDTAITKRGYTSDEFFKLGVRDLIDPQKKGRFEKIVREIRRKGHYIGEMEVARKDGSLMSVEATLTLVKSRNRDYVISITHDITRRKEVEKANRDMERKAQVSSRLAMIGEMAAGIAHEINNPLTGVIGFASILVKRDDLPADARQKLRIINEGGRRVGAIVKGLLTFARQSRTGKTYVDINEILEGTVKLMAYELQTSNIEVVLKLDTSIPYTMADAGQLQQVFLNLLVNAEQEIKTSADAGIVEIRTSSVDEVLEIVFKDNGPGIAKEHLDKVFDPFFTTKKVGVGTGLGLSLSHGIVTEHGGRLYVKSTKGKGATFIVELPVIEDERYSLDADQSGKSPAVIRGKILVIDDEMISSDFLEQVLEQDGHQVTVAKKAQQALKEVTTNNYDVILLDVKMPGMSGMEFYHLLMGSEQSLAEKVIFITGDVVSPETQQFLSEVKRPLINKPIDIQVLKQLVSRQIRASKKKDQ